MKPLAQLNNVERAKLLFELFPGCISDFLVFQKEVTDNLMRDPDQLKENWDNGFITMEFWIRLAAETQKTLDKYNQRLTKRSQIFADQLFHGYKALYAAHCLQQYVKHHSPSDMHFKNAVELLFM